MSSISPHSAPEWSHDFLQAAGFPVTAENIRAVLSWEYAESGNPPNAARFNPLNTTQREPGSWNFNLNGGYPVQNYRSYQDGLRANATVIHNGYYSHVVAALQAGNNAQAVVDAVVASPWGTRHIHLVPPVTLSQPPSYRQEDTLTTLGSPFGGWARPEPAYGCVLLGQGAAVEGDRASGANRTWVSTDPVVVASGHHIVDVYAKDGENDQFWAIYDLGNHNLHSYALSWRKP